MRQLFIDLDGVLADFDGFYETLTGSRPDRNAADPPDFWTPIDAHGAFFRSLPVMPDARELWALARELHPEPIILTGMPWSVADAEAQKRAWVAEHIDPTVHVICCKSRDKRNHAKPGDVLVDDWVRYRHLWEDMGGIFVLHTSTADTEPRLRGIFNVWPR